MNTFFETKNIFIETSENIPIWFYLVEFYYYVESVLSDYFIQKLKFKMAMKE